MNLSPKNALRTFHEKTTGFTDALVICGSVSTYLQGCQITPNDIDVLALDMNTVKKVAEILSVFAVEETPSQEVDAWLSTQTNSLFIDISEDESEQWVMGRWVVDGVKVEVVYIVSESVVNSSRKKGYIWENGPDMYHYIRTIDFHGSSVQVIPLEIQLGTCLRRELNDRVTEIVKVLLNKGVNIELLKRSLTSHEFEKMKQAYPSLLK